jgi:hypothetical protein
MEEDLPRRASARWPAGRRLASADVSCPTTDWCTTVGGAAVPQEWNAYCPPGVVCGAAAWEPTPPVALPVAARWSF